MVWWDVSKNGQGVQLLHNLTDNSLSGVWYLYDENGEGMWLTFIGEIEQGIVNTTLERFNGPALGTQWNDTVVNQMTAGNLMIQLNSPASLVFEYSVNGVSGVLNLQPFAL